MCYSVFTVDCLFSIIQYIKQSLKSNPFRRFRVFDKQKLFKIGVVFFVFIAIAAVLLRLLFSKTTQAPETTIPVVVTKGILSDLQKDYKINAYIEPKNMVQVHSKVSGNITTFRVDIGDKVKAGDELLLINDAPYRLQFEQASAAYDGIGKIYERVRRSYNQGVATQQEYDEARTRYEATKSQYELAKLQMDYARVDSPIDGTVLQKYVSTGQLVSPDVGLLVVADLSELVVRAKLPEDNFFRFNKDRDKITVKIKHPAEDTLYAAHIERIGEMVEPQSKNFEVVCNLDEGYDFLRPGMFVNVIFILERKEDVYSLPIRTLVGDDVLWYVNPDTMRAERMIFQPVFSDDDSFEIPNGYKDYYFIVEGQNFIYDGQPVSVKNTDDYPELSGEQQPVSESEKEAAAVQETSGGQDAETEAESAVAEESAA